MCMDYLQVNIVVVCGYLREYFGDVGSGEEGINLYGICTG